MFAPKTGPIVAPQPPQLPVAPNKYDPVYMEQYANILRLYFNQLTQLVGAVFSDLGGLHMRFPYGAFHNSNTQTQTTANTAKAVTFNSTDLSSKIVLNNASKIKVENAGIYNFQFSLQLDRSSGSAGHTYIWARVNGVDVPNSTSEVAVQGTAAEAIAAWNFVLQMAANDTFELMWSVSDAAIQIKAVGATAGWPATPSVIMTVTFVSALPL